MSDETIVALYDKILSFAHYMLWFWNDLTIRFPVVTTRQLNIMGI